MNGGLNDRGGAGWFVFAVRDVGISLETAKV